MSIEAPSNDLPKPQKSWVKRGCLGCGGATIALLIIIGVVAAMSGGKSGKTATPFSISQDVVTLDEYNRLQNGISYKQAVEIIGAEGTENASNAMPGVPGVMAPIETKSYIWQNRNGSNVILMFQNDKMMQKAQALLK